MWRSVIFCGLGRMIGVNAVKHYTLNVQQQMFKAKHHTKHQITGEIDLKISWLWISFILGSGLEFVLWITELLVTIYIVEIYGTKMWPNCHQSVVNCGGNYTDCNIKRETIGRCWQGETKRCISTRHCMRCNSCQINICYNVRTDNRHIVPPSTYTLYIQHKKKLLFTF